MSPMPVRGGTDVLAIDCGQEAGRIAAWLVEAAARTLRKRGVVVALSGGVDSSVCVGLAARAFGGDRVLALLLPERESPASGAELARRVVGQFGVETVTQDITGPLEGLGCYRLRDEAIRALVPEYGDAWRSKLVLRGERGGFRFFALVTSSPDGAVLERRLPHQEYLQILAAQNYKQRVRKIVEYSHADRRNYAVLGTPNRLEYDQGFFVKNGDGSADAKPIAHLYKTQVYALARHLGLPEEICRSVPSTDTYSLAQGQDEFYFGLPYQDMDLALWAINHGWPAAELGRVLGLDEVKAGLIYQDIESKREATRPLHSHALLVEPVGEIRPFA